MIFQQLRKDLIDGKIKLEDLDKYAQDFSNYGLDAATAKKVDMNELNAFIMLCLDYYTYSDSGLAIIPDHQYDMAVQRYYEELGGRTPENTITYPDPISGGTKWNFIPHKIPGMVGTISAKLYTYAELKAQREYYHETDRFIIAPKYDGVSVSIELVDGKIISAATRYDGMVGQDITALVKRAKLPKWWGRAPDGFYKCEMLVSTNDFNELVQIKKYANRRSATSGIINTPKNIGLGQFITIVPLLYYNPNKHLKKYIAPGAKEIQIYSTADLRDAIDEMLEDIRSESFPFRVDGVVITPVGITEMVNEGDLLENSFAYKVNTNEAKTTIEYGYMSVGRLGSVVPMLKVRPVEVNETIVTDVSLGSYAKFQGMELHEHEEVIVYSAGDVIPQVKLPLVRTNWGNEADLHMDKHCPHCGHKFTKIGTEYFCKNPKCPKVQSGKIANFIDKLGVEGFSDKTIAALNDAGLLGSIEDLFTIDAQSIMNVPGFDRKSAEAFAGEINKIKTRPIPVSEFFGALGIEGISMKKARKIFAEISLKKLMKNPTKRSIAEDMRCAEGIGRRTAQIFVAFVDENYELIKYLLDQMNIVGDKSYQGNVAFTGFRNSRWEEKFNRIGYEVSDTVNKDTVALISANDDYRSTKCISAMKKGIPIYHYRDIDEVFSRLQHGQSLGPEYI